MIPPLDNVIEPESGPAAPASELAAALPAVDPTSPAAGPVIQLAPMQSSLQLIIDSTYRHQVAGAIPLPTQHRTRKPSLQTFLE